MSLTFNTNDPSYLLGVFRKMIADNHVQTWSYDGDGDFTHTPEQWKNRRGLGHKSCRDGYNSTSSILG